MIGALWILAFLLAVGLVLYLADRRRPPADIPESRAAEKSSEDAAPEDRQTDSGGEECCGLHAVCEKMYPPAGKTVYYDDEELDRFKGRQADTYTDGEIEEFRDVLITLLPADRYGWAQSVDQRGIILPAVIRQELMLLLAEES